MQTWEEYKKTMPVEIPVFEHARRGDLQELTEYLSSGGNPSLKNHKNHSLLMLAAYNDHEAACRLLIDAGADVNSRDNSGNTILMGATFKGYPHIVNLLVECGADTKLRNYLGMTALAFAKMFNREDIMSTLGST